MRPLLRDAGATPRSGTLTPAPVQDGGRDIPDPLPHGQPLGELLGGTWGCSRPSSRGEESRILSSRMGLGETGVPSGITTPSPTVITPGPAPSATSGMPPTAGSAGDADAGHGAGILLPVWICPHPAGGEGGTSPRRRAAASHGKPGNAARSRMVLPEQVLWQGRTRRDKPWDTPQPWRQDKALPSSPAPGTEGKVQLLPTRAQAG